MNLTVEQLFVMVIKKYGPLSLSIADLEDFSFNDSAHIEYNPEGLVVAYRNQTILEGEVIEDSNSEFKE